jgi:hypothetical protein
MQRPYSVSMDRDAIKERYNILKKIIINENKIILTFL